VVLHKFIDQARWAARRKQHLFFDLEVVRQLQLVPVDHASRQLRKILCRGIRA
jgi:hypothetical protein